jgi:butyrate kinase
MKRNSILIINPGSSSTKIAVYEFNKFVYLKSIRHSREKLQTFEKISDQFEYRKDVILNELSTTDVKTDKIVAIVSRGGLVKPIESGVYEVNDQMLHDLKEGIMGEHASNLGGLIAHEIAAGLPNTRAFIVDPVVVDEMQDIARISGHPNFERLSIFHALNQKAVAREHAKSIGKKYEEVNLVVAHLGGGVTIGAHKQGKVVDVNNGLDGDGPFSPERSGSLPVGALAKLCFSGEYSYEQVKKMITGEGGLYAYLGTIDAYEMEQRAVKGDEKAKLLQEAMSYQIAKEIGAYATVLKGNVDAILLTGGIAFDEAVVDLIKDMVSYIAPVIVYPGQDEMKALALNALQALQGEIEIKTYNPAK